MKLLDDLNDDNVFKNERNTFVPAYFDGITIGLAQNIKYYKDCNSQCLSEKVKQLKLDEDFKKYSGSASNSRSRVQKRLTRANQIFSEGCLSK